MPTKLLYYAPSSAGLGGRKEDEKELMGRDKSSLIKKKLRLHAEAKGNKNIYSVLPISRQWPAISWELGYQYAQWLLRKTNLVMKVPFSSFRLAFVAEQPFIWYGISF